MAITKTGKAWQVTVTERGGTQRSYTLNEGTLDEVRAFVVALLSPVSTFRIEEIKTDPAVVMSVDDYLNSDEGLHVVGFAR